MRAPDLISDASVRSLMCEIVSLIRQSLPHLYSNRFNISYKSDNSPVTQADLYLEDLISRFIRDKLGQVFFIGEESFSSQLSLPSKGYSVILDPIDGTETSAQAFLSGAFLSLSGITFLTLEVFFFFPNLIFS